MKRRYANYKMQVQNTGYMDAQGTQWVLQQQKNEPIRNEGDTN